MKQNPLTKGQQDGSTDKGICCQATYLSLIHRIQHKGRGKKKNNLYKVFALFKYVVAQVHTHTHTHTYTNTSIFFGRSLCLEFLANFLLIILILQLTLSLYLINMTRIDGFQTQLRNWGHHHIVKVTALYHFVYQLSLNYNIVFKKSV